MCVGGWGWGWGADKIVRDLDLVSYGVCVGVGVE